MFKDILVPMLAGDIPDAAVRVASAIGKAGQSRVDALVGVSMITPNAAAWASYPESFCETLKEAADAAVGALAARAEARLAEEGVPHGVRRCSSIWLTTAEMAALCARYADLIVLGRGKTLGGFEQRLFGALLMGCGRPLLLVPDEAPPTDAFETVVVAWKSSREAARALHDALPFLRKARSVELLAVDEDRHREEDAGSDDALLLGHLSRHGIAATPVRRAHGGMSSAARILQHAADSRADLVVAGGFGHSRAREQLFGGVTRALFEHSTQPVLFSH